MKIAISTAGDRVAEHFGRCREYTIVEIENGEIKNRETLSNPGHQKGFLPKFLKEKNVDCVITGGIGRKAINLFEDLNIKVMVGITGTIDSVIQDFISGDIEEGESLCRPGNGKKTGYHRD